MNILVLCTDNAARSILLESILNQDSAGRIHAYSAGSQPSGRVHPQSMKLLAQLGYPTARLSSQSWNDFTAEGAPHMDVVITVCDSAAAQTCPLWPQTAGRPPIKLHWGIPDPAAAAETDWPDTFRTVYDSLVRMAQLLLAVPFEGMTHGQLKDALTGIDRS